MVSIVVFAYFGPETTLPLASTLAAIAGVVLATARAATRWFATRIRPQERR